MFEVDSREDVLDPLLVETKLARPGGEGREEGRRFCHHPVVAALVADLAEQRGAIEFLDDYTHAGTLRGGGSIAPGEHESGVDGIVPQCLGEPALIGLLFSPVGVGPFFLSLERIARRADDDGDAKGPERRLESPAAEGVEEGLEPAAIEPPDHLEANPLLTADRQVVADKGQADPLRWRGRRRPGPGSREVAAVESPQGRHQVAGVEAGGMAVGERAGHGVDGPEQLVEEELLDRPVPAIAAQER